MATIVRHQTSGETYLLLGSGYGAFQSKKPNAFFGDWLADTEEGQFSMLCVSNRYGEIGWIDSSDLKVESVDGKSVDAHFDR